MNLLSLSEFVSAGGIYIKLSLVYVRFTKKNSKAVTARPFKRNASSKILTIPHRCAHRAGTENAIGDKWSLKQRSAFKAADIISETHTTAQTTDCCQSAHHEEEASLFVTELLSKNLYFKIPHENINSVLRGLDYSKRSVLVSVSHVYSLSNF